MRNARSCMTKAIAEVKNDQNYNRPEITMNVPLMPHRFSDKRPAQRWKEE